MLDCSRRGLTSATSLLYCALRILLRRPYLTSPVQALRDKNRSICLEHSRKIYAIHTLYTRTFPHRLMTYQVSYCIYIAATIEALEQKSPTSKQAREAAATRLAAAVRILQNEASHTPGSGKSLDTIRRLLSAAQQKPAFTQQQQQRTIGGHGHRLAQNNEDDADGEHNVYAENNSDVAQTPSGQHEQQNHAAGFESGVIVAVDDVHCQAEHNNIPVSAGQSTTCPNDSSRFLPTNSHQGSSLGYGSSFLAGEGAAVWDDGFGVYGGTDTGAGFHPDTFPWRVSDMFPRDAEPSVADVG